MTLVQEIDNDVCMQADELLATHDDPFAEHRELDGFSIHAAYGHTHRASAHEKLIYAYYPAIIDYKQWQKWKQGSGVYAITLEKKNSVLEPLSYTSKIAPSFSYGIASIRNITILRHDSSVTRNQA